MPIFDFTCKECGNTFEKIVKSSDILPECPLCGSRNTAKEAIQKFGFEMKGVGVYNNNTH